MVVMVEMLPFTMIFCSGFNSLRLVDLSTKYKAAVLGLIRPRNISSIHYIWSAFPYLPPEEALGGRPLFQEEKFYG